MDLTRYPGNSASLPAAQDPAVLVKALGEASERLGFALPTRVIPGGIPSVDIAPENFIAACMFLRDQMSFDLLSSVSGVDMLEDRYDVAYHLRSMQRGWLLQLKVRVTGALPEIESVMGIWPTANWLERETYDMYGITFTGHPDLRRILLDDEFEGFPLRKSFRPSPLTVHDPATTEAPPDRAIAGEGERGVGHQRIVSNLLSQGDQERLHPGTPTFGSTQFHGRDFPPTTWKHALERAAEEEKDEEKK